MILVRSVFQAKYGRGGELVALLKEGNQRVPTMPQTRIFTDASGPFFIVVTEAEVASLGEWERVSKEIFAHPDFGEWFARMQPLVDWGRREFYNIEA